jgi:hypothetical protein
MSGITIEIAPFISGRRVLVAWMLGAFVVTFLVTRFITRAIRSGRGPFRDANVGGVHVHHAVYGIFLMLGAGAAEFTYNPAPPWVHLLAVVFGVGAALTLDEFALWLHLKDVYWSREGRSSIQAVLIACVVGGLLLVGANPFDADRAGGEMLVAATVVVNLLFALVGILKGRAVLAVVGIFVPVVALFLACRVARPDSPWARRWYRPGSWRDRRSHARFQPGRRTRWDALVDLFAAVAEPAPTAVRAGSGDGGAA